MSYIGSPTPPVIATVSDDSITSQKIDSTSTGMTFADLTVDTDTLVVDETNNTVGIGTSSPSANLDIEDSDTARIQLKDTGDTRSGLITVRNGDINIIAGSDLLGSATEKTKIQMNDGKFITFSTDSTERMRIDSSGNLKFNSGYGSASTAYGVRAWCKWNMSGTQAILGSGGVSSITDQGTGRTDINFLETMPDINYAATYTIGNNIAEWWTSTFTTTSVRCSVYTGSAYTDQNNNSCIVAR